MINPNDRRAEIDEKTRMDLEEKIEMKCSYDLQCETPFYYAIRSSCSFDSICYQGECRATCRKQYGSEEEARWGGPRCTKNEDCDCSHYTYNDFSECVCHN